MKRLLLITLFSLLASTALSQGVAIDTVGRSDSVNVGRNRWNSNDKKLRDSLNYALQQIKNGKDTMGVHRTNITNIIAKIVGSLNYIPKFGAGGVSIGSSILYMPGDTLFILTADGNNPAIAFSEEVGGSAIAYLRLTGVGELSINASPIVTRDWYIAARDTLMDKPVDPVGLPTVPHIGVPCYDPVTGIWTPCDQLPLTTSPPSTGRSIPTFKGDDSVSVERDSVWIYLPLGSQSDVTVVGTALNSKPAPFAFEIIQVYAFFTTAPSGGTSLIDFNINGTSALGATKLQVLTGQQFSTNKSDLTEGVTTIQTNTVARNDILSGDVDAIFGTAKGLCLIILAYKL